MTEKTSMSEAAVKPEVSYRHTYRLFGLLGAFLVLAVVARQLLIPGSFGEDGWFRGLAPKEARSRPVKHIQQSACVTCHEKQDRLHDKDVHAMVQCETCHGPGSAHADDPEHSKITIPEGKEPCLTCHQRLVARPGSFPQIDWREHYTFVGVEDQSIDCMSCHDPHEPLFMDRDLRSARLHPLIQRCQDCHVGTIGLSAKPPEHPITFECSYCHQDIVTDFETRTHSFVDCTTCHFFIKESDFAGRIIRDADPRFCLLCHREADFRSRDAPPSISWPEHLDDVADGPEDAQKRCIDCHRDKMHAPNIVRP